MPTRYVSLLMSYACWKVFYPKWSRKNNNFVIVSSIIMSDTLIYVCHVYTYVRIYVRIYVYMYVCTYIRMSYIRNHVQLLYTFVVVQVILLNLTPHYLLWCCMNKGHTFWSFIRSNILCFAVKRNATHLSLTMLSDMLLLSQGALYPSF